jgi:phage-related minor tail protein
MADGGVLDRPTSMGMFGNREVIAGEAGPEVFIPLDRLPAMVADINQRGGGAGTQDVADLRRAVTTLANRPVRTYVVASELDAQLLSLHLDRGERSL